MTTQGSHTWNTESQDFFQTFSWLKCPFLALKNKELHKEENKMAFIFMCLPSVDKY